MDNFFREINMNQYNTKTLSQKRPLQSEADIVELHHKREGTATEQDFKDVLRKYNLRDGLITLGRTSNYLFNAKGQNRIGRAAYREPNKGVIVSQFALAYLANILLVSGANDYKSKYISQKDNLLTFCNSYSNCLTDPALTEKYKITNKDGFRSFIIRMNFEQMEYQFSPIYMMARTIVIFNELLQNINPDKFEPLSEIFQKETGLSIYDYLRLCFAFFAGSQKTATFSVTTFTNADIPQFKDFLTEEKIIKALDILKGDYKKFREEDTYVNEKLKPVFTKTRLNPLLIYPIIETDVKNLGDPYVIPNIVAYIRKSFGGLYWWFHRYFENQNKQQDFRNYFGRVFQEYVGKILKNIYGERNVHEEIVYGKGLRFIDWWIKKDDKIYLFESKASQFALLSKQTGDKEIVVKNEIKKKVVEAIKQVYKRVKDISKYEELKRFRGKQVIPFIVFMDIPFVSGYLYEPWITEALEEIEQKKSVIGLKDFPFFLINIEELELYDECTNIIEIEDIFPKLKENIKEGFLSVLSKSKGGGLRNRYLDKIYKDFWETGFGIIVNKKEKIA